MTRQIGRFLLLVLLLLWPATATHAVGESSHSEWAWSTASRIVAIGDVHGSYDDLVLILRGLDLVDTELVWTGGEQHLVMVGDLLDRGRGDRPILDLVMRLGREAEAAGGKVHVVLGNHEVMNLVRDMRYVNPETYEDFAEFEVAEVRKAYQRKFVSEHLRPGISQAKLGEAFRGAFPPGYFGRLQAFEADGAYGAWLLGLPAVIRINGYLFVHGGLTEEVAELGIDEINRQVTASLRAYLQARKVLEEKLDTPVDRDEIEALAEHLSGRGTAPERVAAARDLLAQTEALPARADGPFWYRGLSQENERLARDSLGRTLTKLGARAMVIGHTPTGNGRITSRFEGRVFRTDMGMVYGNPPMALVLDADLVRVFDPGAMEFRPPLAEAPQGQGWARKYEELPDAKLEKFLARAEITGCVGIEIENRSCEVCELERKGLRLRGVYLAYDEAPEPHPGGTIQRRYAHEVAAYKLDRLLGMDLVPVTVLRTRDGVEGALRIFVETALDLGWIRSHQRWDLLEGLEERIGEARLLNSLLASDERLDVARMLIPTERRILFGDHSRSFPLSPRVPAKFPISACDSLSAKLELAFRELEPSILNETMKGLLSRAQVTSLLERRDAVLDLCANRDETDGNGEAGERRFPDQLQVRPPIDDPGGSS